MGKQLDDDMFIVTGGEGYVPPDNEARRSAPHQTNGDKWYCVMGDTDDETMANFLVKSLEDATLYGQVVTDFHDKVSRQGTVIMLEYSEQKDDPICCRSIIIPTKSGNNELLSWCPIIKKGVLVHVKINYIRPWDSGLEAWITGDILQSNGGTRTLTFLDADYALHKDAYKIAYVYPFVIGALVSEVSEQSSEDFDFADTQASNSPKKAGKGTAHKKGDKVPPSHISFENLCMIVQLHSDFPDEVDFITTINGVEFAKSFSRRFFKFDILINSSLDPDCKIMLPAYARRSPQNEVLLNAKQVQGNAFLIGYLAI